MRLEDCGVFGWVQPLYQLGWLAVVDGRLVDAEAHFQHALQLAEGIGYAAAIGFALSVPYDLPSGPAIIAVSGVLALLAWFVRLDADDIERQFFSPQFLQQIEVRLSPL